MWSPEPQVQLMWHSLMCLDVDSLSIRALVCSWTGKFYNTAVGRSGSRTRSPVISFTCSRTEHFSFLAAILFRLWLMCLSEKVVPSGIQGSMREGVTALCKQNKIMLENFNPFYISQRASKQAFTQSPASVWRGTRLLFRKNVFPASEHGTRGSHQILI